MRFCSSDFPENFIDMAHPQDYLALDYPIPPEFIYHKNGQYSRLILRISWNINNTYVPMSFVCDTSAPLHFYLSEKSMEVLEKGGRIKPSVFDVNCVHMQYGGLNNCSIVAAVKPTPQNFRPANLIGLAVLSKLGLRVDKDRFSFEKAVVWF